MNLGQKMARLKELLVEEIAKDEDAGTLCAAIIQPGGSLIADYGECGGTAWVRLVNAYPSKAFPTPDVDPRSCASALAYPVEIGILRPAPMGEVNQSTGEWEPPDDAEQDAASLRQYDDLTILHRVYSRFSADEDDFVLGTYTPMGLEGGIYGGVWTATISESF